MRFLWIFLIILSAVVANVFITSFTLLQCMIILNFGIPWTKYVEQKGILKINNGIRKRYLYSIGLLLISYIASVLFVFLLAKLYTFWYIIMSIILLMFGMKQTGYNANNHADWIKRNKRYLNNDIKDDDYIALIKDVEQKMISGKKRSFGHEF
jgi:hypothetical protein